MKKKGIVYIVYLSNKVHCFARRFSGDDLKEFDSIVFHRTASVETPEDKLDSVFGSQADKAELEKVKQEARERGIAFIHGLDNHNS